MSDINLITHPIYLADVERARRRMSRARLRWRGTAIFACLLVLVAAAGRALT